MPAARRGATAATPDNMTMCAMIKEQNKLAASRPEATTLEIDTKAPASKNAKEESEEAIFSACHSPEDEHNLDDGAAVADLEGFELNYLHQLYTVPDGTDMFAHTLTDAILPDATAPPSLGYSAQVAAALKTEPAPSAPASHGAAMPEDSEEPSSAHSADAGGVSAPSTPPRSGKGEWAAAARDPSPVPAPRAAQKTSGRKRRASTLHGSPQPTPPVKQSRTSAAAQKREEREREKEAAAAAAAAAATHASEEDESDEESAHGGPPTLDGLEIRPEDDPLGLFSRDPATLTPEEQRLLKKQRRLLKNRESAQLSRHRKKMHLHALEKQVEALKRDKAALAQKVQALHDDNERLRKQLISAA